MKLNHIGYITGQIEETKNFFLHQGYVSNPVIDFEAHKCKICFLRKEGETTVELVEPYEDNRSLRKLLKNGVTPYHLCYEVEDIATACEKFVKEGFFQLSEPVPAPAFDNRMICYLWSQYTGYIELLNI